jgi:hypothetical protein
LAAVGQEAEVNAGADLDFTTLLDDLMAASAAAEAVETSAPSPSLHVDLLAQLERLQADNKGLFADRAETAYREQLGTASAAPRQQADATPAHLAPLLDDLFFLDPESIARELGIQARSRPEELDKARRTFALRYHPDRVPEEFRERAALRMQIANMLIDKAKGKKR